MALVISTWRWGDAYGDHYVDRLRAGVARHLKQPYEFRVFEPDAEDQHLTEVPGCLARLRMWSPEWQARQGINRGDRLVTLDLDLIVTGPLDPLFDQPHPFMIASHMNTANPCIYNGSVQMLRAGYRPEVWTDFSLNALEAAPRYSFGDDQGWLAFKVPHEATWQAGPSTGLYGYHKRGWPGGTALPKGARIVAFPGHRDPSQFTHLDWVKAHWIGP